MITEQEINGAYAAQKKATENYFKAAEQAIKAKQDYESKVLFALTSGQIVGKNQAERDAAARDIYSPEYNFSIKKDEEERTAKLEFDLAALEVSRVRALLRIAEITAGMVEYSGK